MSDDCFGPGTACRAQAWNKKFEQVIYSQVFFDIIHIIIIYLVSTADISGDVFQVGPWMFQKLNLSGGFLQDPWEVHRVGSGIFSRIEKHFAFPRGNAQVCLPGHNRPLEGKYKQWLFAQKSWSSFSGFM